MSSKALNKCLQIFRKCKNFVIQQNFTTRNVSKNIIKVSLALQTSILVSVQTINMHVGGNIAYPNTD